MVSKKCCKRPRKNRRIYNLVAAPKKYTRTYGPGLKKDKNERGVKFTKNAKAESTHNFIDIVAGGSPITLQEAKAAADEIAGNPMPDKVMPSHARAYHQEEKLKLLIEKRKKLAVEFANVTPEMIIGATAMRAFASIDDAFDEEGNFDIQKARETGAIHLIKKLEKTQHGWKVEFYDAASAQDKLGNYLGMEIAPKENSDEASIMSGVKAIALQLAKDHSRADFNGGHIAQSHLVEAWKKVAQWCRTSRVKYSVQSLESVARELEIGWKTIRKETKHLMSFTPSANTNDEDDFDNDENVIDITPEGDVIQGE